MKHDKQDELLAHFVDAMSDDLAIAAIACVIENSAAIGQKDPKDPKDPHPLQTKAKGLLVLLKEGIRQTLEKFEEGKIKCGQDCSKDHDPLEIIEAALEAKQLLN